MKVNTPYIIPKDPDMSQQMDLTLQSYFGDGMFRPSILREIGKGLGILGASSQKSKIYTLSMAGCGSLNRW